MTSIWLTCECATFIALLITYCSDIDSMMRGPSNKVAPAIANTTGSTRYWKSMQKYRAINTAVFLVWEYGGIPLGGTRFENIRSLTTQALRDLQPDTLDPPATPPKGAEGTQGQRCWWVRGQGGLNRGHPPHFQTHHHWHQKAGNNHAANRK